MASFFSHISWFKTCYHWLLYPGSQSVNFTSLCLSQSVLPICSQYCHLCLLYSQFSPSPVHFIYFQGKTPLRNLQWLLIAGGEVYTPSKAFQDSTHLPLPLQNASGPANLRSSTSVSTIPTNSFPPLFDRTISFFISLPISQMKKLTPREVKGLGQCLWCEMNPSFSLRLFTPLVSWLFG